MEEEHLRFASGEREHYKNCCNESKAHVQAHLGEVDFAFGQKACSYEGTVHYSYDYAQQLHYPSNPNQPGPIYFKTPRKCSLFGVCCEAIPRQVNFLIDENVLTGKGANSTISYVHYFFENHRLGETHAQIHTDNCGAQNKNSAFLWYYLWRVINGLHSSINYDFLLPGHTKFAPDWCFGLVKQKTRRTFISSLFDIARAVEESASVNVAEFVGLHNGTVRVPTFDWVTYLGQFFKKLPNIKSYYHFRFDKDFPGTIYASIQCGRRDVEKSEVAVQTEFPDVMDDLKDQIRQFTKIVADLTALRNNQSERHNRHFSDEEILSMSDSLSDVVPFDPDAEVSSNQPAPETPPEGPQSLNPQGITQSVPLAATNTTAMAPPPPRPPSLQLRSPLSTIDPNVQIVHRTNRFLI